MTAMDEAAAKQIIAEYKERKPSEVGDAVDVLYRQHRSYQAIAHRLDISAKLLSSRHRISRLPEGIRWQIDENRVTITQGCQIAKLPDADDQWFLTFVIVDENLKLTDKQLGSIINAVVQENFPLRESLRKFAGVHGDSTKPVMMPFGFDERLAISKAAWEKHKNIEDFCLFEIRAGKDIDREKMANQLEKISSELRVAGQ